MPTRATLCALALVSASGAAQAAFFSFSSDSADHAWTFTGNGSTFTQATSANDPIVLMIDDNNGPLPALVFSTRFTATTTLAFAGDVPVGGAVSHNYTASGSFTFVDIATNTPILTGAYTGQLFTARGAASSWFTTAALQGSSAGNSVMNLTWSGAPLPGYGLLPGAAPGEFAFALDTINTSGVIPYGGQSPGVGLTNSLPNAPWFSEASFVAATVPGPAGLALLGLAGMVAGRRRRA